MPVLTQPGAVVVEGVEGGDPVSVVAPANDPADSALSGQITVSTAGTEVQGPNIALPNGVYISALAGNAGVVYVGNDGAGAVSSSTGYQLRKDGPPILVQVSNLNKLWFDAATNGDKVCWIKA